MSTLFKVVYNAKTTGFFKKFHTLFLFIRESHHSCNNLKEDCWIGVIICITCCSCSLVESRKKARMAPVQYAYWAVWHRLNVPAAEVKVAEHKWIWTQVYCFVDVPEALVEPVIQILDRPDNALRHIISKQVSSKPSTADWWSGYTISCCDPSQLGDNVCQTFSDIDGATYIELIWSLSGDKLYE